MVKVKNDLQQLIILYVCCCAYNVYYLCKMHQNTLFAALRFCRKFNLFLWKSTKTVAIRADPFGPDMHQIVCRLQGASSHTPHGELTAPPDPLAGLGGGPRGRERKKGRERERKRGEGNRKGEEARWWEGKLDTPDFQMDWRLCFIVFCQWWHNVPCTRKCIGEHVEWKCEHARGCSPSGDSHFHFLIFPTSALDSVLYLNNVTKTDKFNLSETETLGY